MTRIQCRDRKWLGFCVEVQKYLVLVYGSKLTWFLWAGIEIGLILDWGSIWHDFSSGVEINLIFLWGIEFDLVLVLGSKVTFFVRGIEIDRVRAEINLFWVWWSIDLVFVWVVLVEIDSVLGYGPQIAWFYCEHRNWLGFCLGGRYCLDFSVGAKLDLISVQGPEFICCVSGGREWVGFIVSGSKLTWILCDVRPQVDIIWSLDRCVCYVLEDHSVTVDWVTQWFILYKRTKEVRGFKFQSGRVCDEIRLSSL